MLISHCSALTLAQTQLGLSTVNDIRKWWCNTTPHSFMSSHSILLFAGTRMSESAQQSTTIDYTTWVLEGFIKLTISSHLPKFQVNAWPPPWTRMNKLLALLWNNCWREQLLWLCITCSLSSRGCAPAWAAVLCRILPLPKFRECTIVEQDTDHSDNLGVLHMDAWWTAWSSVSAEQCLNWHSFQY